MDQKVKSTVEYINCTHEKGPLSSKCKMSRNKCTMHFRIGLDQRRGGKWKKREQGRNVEDVDFALLW